MRIEVLFQHARWAERPYRSPQKASCDAQARRDPQMWVGSCARPCRCRSRNWSVLHHVRVLISLASRKRRKISGAQLQTARARGVTPIGQGDQVSFPHRVRLGILRAHALLLRAEEHLLSIRERAAVASLSRRARPQARPQRGRARHRLQAAQGHRWRGNSTSTFRPIRVRATEPELRYGVARSLMF